MKKWKCSDCKREKYTEDKIILVRCKCGGYYKLIDEVKDGE